MAEHDPYSRFEYRRLIAWSARIEREWPFLEPILGDAPTNRVLDLGSGSGEHSRFLASKGFAVTGIDSSESMIRSARDEEVEGATFVEGDFTELESVVEGTFGAAICLGNALPHLRTEELLRKFAAGSAAVLEADAPLVIQILNYDRIISQKERYLPVNFRPDPDGEGTIVFLRLMDPHDDGSVIFYPSSLRLMPESDHPLEVVASRRVELRGWRRSELESILIESGFSSIATFGGFDGTPWDPVSRDLIVVARR